MILKFQKYKHNCPSCKTERLVSYEIFRRIRTGQLMGRCNKCANKLKNSNLSIRLKISAALKGRMPKNIKTIAGWNKGLGRKKDILVCELCKKNFLLRSRKETRRFCSRNCMNLHRQISENAANWQGGKTNKLTLLRHSREGADWRKFIFERDDYTCQMCGERGGRLEADHIMPISLYPEMRLDTLNGRTLCKECHKETDTYLHKVFGYDSVAVIIRQLAKV